MTDEVTIESLGAGGAGVSHLPDGMIVFVPRTAPGDRVRLRELRRHKRHAEALVAEIVEPGPGRVEPPCPHYIEDRCGGCQWQHVGADIQLASKGQIVVNALRRIGGIELPALAVEPSPRAFGYRATITLSVRRRGSDVIAGFHDYTNPDRIFMLERCLIARDELNALWSEVRGMLAGTPRGDDVRLRMRVADDGTRQVAVDDGDGWKPFGGAERAEAGTFEQVNPEVAAMLRAAVIEAAEAGRSDGQTVGRSRILDLYAGAGDTALPLAQAGHEVVMVEQDSRAVMRADSRAREAGVKLKCIAGRVEDHIAKLLPADVVIVNPPRAGLSADVADRLTVRPPDRLVYVSCDPATLARDLKRMGAGTGVSVRAYDMFPQTSHVETLAVVDLNP